MKKIPYTRLSLLSAMLLCASLQAQDIHYSQFHNAPFAISPGLTGVFKEDTRLMANYRRQWSSIHKVNYETYSVAADMKLWPYRPNTNGFFALGISINRDQAGLSKLTLLNLGLDGSYTRRLTDHAFLSFGLQGAFNQKKFDIDGLTFDNQFDQDTGFNPSSGNGETRFNSTSTFFSLGAGLNLRLQKLSERTLVDVMRCRSKLDIGFGISNLNQPDQSFEEDVMVRLPRRITPYVLSYIQLGCCDSKWDLAVNGMAQFQQKYSEILGMLGLRYHLSQFPDDHKAIQLSGALRFSDNNDNNADAIAPVLELFLNEWQFGVSFDITVSPFKTVLRGNNALEFSLRYGITKVKLPSPNCCWIL